MKNALSTPRRRAAAALAAVAAAVLAAVILLHAALQGPLAAAQQTTLQAARRQALPQAETFQPQAVQGISCLIGKKGHDTAGYLFETSGQSGSGSVVVLTGITRDGTISGISLLRGGDTPVFTAQSSSFLRQFQQKVPAYAFSLTLANRNTETEIAAMPGAVSASRAVVEAVNRAVSAYQKVKGGI